MILTVSSDCEIIDNCFIGLGVEDTNESSAEICKGSCCCRGVDDRCTIRRCDSSIGKGRNCYECNDEDADDETRAATHTSR